MATPYSSRRSGKRPLVGTPPDSGTELHELSARKPKRPNEDDNLFGSPTKKLKRSPSAQLIVPFRERFVNQPEADRINATREVSIPSYSQEESPIHARRAGRFHGEELSAGASSLAKRTLNRFKFLDSQL